MAVFYAFWGLVKGSQFFVLGGGVLCLYVYFGVCGVFGGFGNILPIFTYSGLRVGRYKIAPTIGFSGYLCCALYVYFRGCGSGDIKSPLHFCSGHENMTPYLYFRGCGVGNGLFGYLYCFLCLPVLVINTGDYNFSSAQVRLRSFHCERLHLPDLTWRRRSHSRSYATNCPNF
ncbi:Uncharacterised protein [Urinicoccus massiliensis]|uniref:Uncharacterized protein n=1 Tax=Urinicoccus massiliensis TaxID=1723382 RepID=A0A8H2M5Y1_9FIRM|nr:Uncharacterised protein [Urinicoccus massiliensis]